MDQPQTTGMQCLSIERIQHGTIFFRFGKFIAVEGIPDQRQADGFHVYSNLMSAAGF